jgi:hypothetical protein
MDRDRFDALARLLAVSGSRRATLGALLGALLGPAAAGAARKRRKDRGNDKAKAKNRDQNPSGAENREREQRLQAEGRKGGKRRKTKKKRGGRGNDGGGQPPPPPPDGCCGTKQCDDPKPGSTRSECDHAGRSFVGQDHNGSTFRGIDGREANFNQTDNHGSVFAEACLQGASFRRANLAGSTWGGACLFGADFTAADLGNESAVFAGALFCGTTMPDGSVNDRDCGRETACCRAQPAPACQIPADCPGQGCRSAFCTNGQCTYTIVVNNDDPSLACGPNTSGWCCEGTCCAAGATECGPDGLCCAPNCAGRECGPDGCGATCIPGCQLGQTCGEDGRCTGVPTCNPQLCPNGCCLSANDASICLTGEGDAFCGSGGEACVDCGAGARCIDHVCVCLAEICDGCCENGSGNSGRCLANTPPVCGVGGAQCTSCPTGDGRTCNAQGECVCNLGSCPNGCCSNGAGNPGICVERQCSQDTDCPNVRDCVCDRSQGACCARNCDGKVCGPDGCGGDCENLCPANTVCNDDGTACLCTAQSCPTGCCSNGLGNPGTCEEGDTNRACGRPGQACQTCTGQDQCQSGQCVCVPTTCAQQGRICGTASDGCGGTLSCGTCGGATPSCTSAGVCAACSVACPQCETCLNLTNGDTVCGEFGFGCGDGCSSNASCPAGAPLCAVSFSIPSGTTTFASVCGGVNPGVVNVCTSSQGC